MAKPLTIRILSFDPALSHFGWAVSDYNVSTGLMTVVRFGTLKPSQTASKVAYRERTTLFTKRMVSLDLLREHVKLLMIEFKPDHVAIEDAFFNRFRPSAFASLTQCICIVAYTLMKSYKHPLHKVAPKSAKLCMTGSGASGKDPIQQSIFNRTDITFKQRKQAEKLNEHEADAISIGFYFCKNILPSTLQFEKIGVGRELTST